MLQMPSGCAGQNAAGGAALRRAHACPPVRAPSPPPPQTPSHTCASLSAGSHTAAGAGGAGGMAHRVFTVRGRLGARKPGCGLVLGRDKWCDGRKHLAVVHVCNTHAPRLCYTGSVPGPPCRAAWRPERAGPGAWWPACPGTSAPPAAGCPSSRYLERGGGLGWREGGKLR